MEAGPGITYTDDVVAMGYGSGTVTPGHTADPVTASESDNVEAELHY